MIKNTFILPALAMFLLGSSAHAQNLYYRSDEGPSYQQDGGSWSQDGNSTWNAPEPDYRYGPRGGYRRYDSRSSYDDQGQYDPGQYEQRPYGDGRSDQRRYQQGEYDPGQAYPGQADPDQVYPETGDWQNDPAPSQGTPRVNANGGVKDDVKAVTEVSPIPREIVAYSGYAPGTIIVSTKERRLYLMLNDDTAVRYGIGVGKQGFSWKGEETVSNKREWPDWTPPKEMIARRPNLPDHMDGGLENPLGARALYLGSTLYRIHGTNEPGSIGKAVSSGCIRMANPDIIDLFNRVNVGTRVVVL